MALTGDVYITEYGVPGDAHQPLNFPVGVGVTVYRGSIALIGVSNGFLKNASNPSSTDICVGLIDTGGPGYPNFLPGVVNNSSTGGWSGVTADVRTGSFYLNCTDGSIVQSTVGQTVYVVNETTVSATQGSLPAAGKLIYIDPAPPPTALGAYVVKFTTIGGP
jgi:hypothetical protein